MTSTSDSRASEPPGLAGDGAEVLVNGRIYVRTTLEGQEIRVGDLVGGWRVKARIIVSHQKMFISFHERGDDTGDPVWLYNPYAILRPKFPTDDERRQNGII